MNVTLHIPDDIAAHLTQGGDNLARRALEAFAVEELKAGRLTEVHLRKLLGLARLELDGFLKAHGIYQEYTLADFERERQALQEAGG